MILDYGVLYNSMIVIIELVLILIIYIVILEYNEKDRYEAKGKFCIYT